MAIGFAARVLSGACAAVMLAGALAFGATPAYAYYNEAAQAYPASQDIGQFIEYDIAGGVDIPDGEYLIDARSTSTMCILHDPVTGEANKARITVQGDQIIATFALSKAYNAIYYGTAEEAASLSNEDGTDDSAYILGDPPSGYVLHTYVMAIPGLNYKTTVATYSGMTKGIPEGKWYTREFVFLSDEEIERLIAEVHQPDDPTPSSEEPAPSEEPTPSEEPVPSGQPAPSENPAPSESPAPSETPSPTPAPTPTPAPSTAQTTPRTTATTTTQPRSSAASTDAATASEADAAASEEGVSVTAAPKLRGTSFTIATSEGELKAKNEVDAFARESETKVGFRLPPEVLLGLGAAALVVAGVLARFLKFRRDFDGPNP